VRALVLALLLAACSPDIEQRAHPNPSAQPAPSASLASQDRNFLERAAEGSNGEIAMGALVHAHASRAEVIAFGMMMVRDHSAANQHLAAIAAAKHIALPTSLGEHQQSLDRIVDLHGEDFDREFARVMLGDHQEATRLFRDEAQNGIDADLKAFAAATLPILEAHLQHAETLLPIQ
jgi:putative membrane protein